MAQEGQFILLLPGDAVVGGDVLGREAHVVAVEDFIETVKTIRSRSSRGMLMRYPQRASGRAKGTLVMFSMPPATMISASPALMTWAARAMAFMPEAQTLLMVMALVSSGRPARCWPAGRGSGPGRP